MIKTDNNGNFSNDEFLSIIKVFEIDRAKYINQNNYFYGKNDILSRTVTENTAGAPDNRISICYGRKLINTITGYMYKPGNVNYKFENDNVSDELFELNNDQLQINQLGIFQGVNGVCYELHYPDTKGKPRWTIVKAQDGLPIYDYSLEANLVAFLRFYEKNGKKYFQFFNRQIIQDYEYNLDNNKILLLSDSAINPYGEVPVIIIKNNNEQLGDIEPVKKLIDAYDILMSDSLNEFDRFAWAYLVLTGTKLDAKDAKEIKQKRIFELIGENAGVNFLTKDIPTAYIEFMQKWVKAEIHRQSFIPDIEELSFNGAASGTAISKWLYQMEYITSQKEAYMKEALYNRISLLSNYPGYESLQNEKYEIVFKRNLPNSDLENSQIYNAYYGKSITEKTLIENFAPFVKDPEKEIEEFKSNQIDIPDLDQLPQDDQDSNDLDDGK